ncbi:YraN family protein [Pseudoalteromonas sp. T1lg65]|uniref:YraN family protein n=1 Tax=Pseudoalteromonas sp. T1lg65 TaxID=2077101 RepID=UPI003F7A172E
MFKGLFNNTRSKGLHFEKMAEQHLKAQGLVAISRNYHCKFGEIDLIMQDSETWVFVEVKYRKSAVYGGAICSLSSTKLQRLKRSAQAYAKQYNLQQSALRIDFVAIQGVDPPTINWIRNIG